MEWDKVATLLGIIHQARDVPGTDNIRMAALDELVKINASVAPKPAEFISPDPQLDLNYGARRL